MERIRDLLQPASNNLPIHEDPQKGPYIKGLKEVYVSNINEIFEVMHAGSQARAVTATKMNEESSRSHSIFMITVHQTNKQDQSSKSSTLYLVDLAGSEKIGKTGASGQTLEEAKKINKSLTALGMVINALTDGKSKHIPYRDSKLTRILQESLGGNSKTTLMINASPMSFNETETISTLRFGYRAKSIKNKAKANVDLSVPQLKKLLAESAARVAQLESHIGKLTSEIKIWRQGGTVAESERAGNFANTTNSTLEEVTIAPISGETTRDAELLVDFEAKEAEVEQLQQTVDELRAKMEAQQTELETWQKRCQDNEELITQMNDLNALTAAPKMDEEIRRKTSNMMAGYASTEEELSPQAVEQPEVASEQVITKPASTSEKAEGDAQAMKQLMERQVAEFDNIRKELVRDLQNRCEKVVELEIALDEASNTNGGKSLHGGTGSLKTKIQTLEYNITQLLQVHKQLILQNSNTKRDHIILDRENTAKSEKISQLERTIQGLNQRLIDSDVRHGKQVENLWAKIAAAGSGMFSFFVFPQSTPYSFLLSAC